jgi:hypothetical protein
MLPGGLACGAGSGQLGVHRRLLPPCDKLEPLAAQSAPAGPTLIASVQQPVDQCSSAPTFESLTKPMPQRK